MTFFPELKCHAIKAPLKNVRNMKRAIGKQYEKEIEILHSIVVALKEVSKVLRTFFSNFELLES